MKTNLVLTFLALALLSGSPAMAKGGRSTSVTGSNGRSATRDISNSASGGTLTRNASTTAANGKSVSGAQQISRTAPGQRTSTGTYTGPNGQTTTTNGSVSYENGARTATRSATGPQGNTHGYTNTTTAK